MLTRIRSAVLFVGLFFLALDAFAAPTWSFPEAAARLCASASTAAPPSATCRLEELSRNTLVGDIVHYEARVRVGPEAHDVIGLHRVVQEVAPEKPGSFRDAVMMVHGDALAFQGAFLTATLVPSGDPELSLPVFLAERGVDVWGIDLRWTLVPAEVSDRSFMRDWGVLTDVGDIETAIGLARQLRALTGSGAGKMHLLGYSRGGQTGYVVVGEEAGRSASERQVKGYVVLDVALLSDVPEARAGACQRAAERRALIASGTFVRDNLGIRLAGVLALTAPDDPSPFLPPFTNRELALLAGGPDPREGEPAFHFVGVDFVPPGIPVGLTYSPEEVWFAFLAASSAYQPLQLLVDLDSITCGEGDVPFDDGFGGVDVPVLYVGAAGGAGPHGTFTPTQLGSSDVSSLVGGLLAPEAAAADLGHVDLVLAAPSEGVFWSPVLEWIRSH